jgi:hypothetical protein
MLLFAMLCTVFLIFPVLSASSLNFSVPLSVPIVCALSVPDLYLAYTHTTTVSNSPVYQIYTWFVFEVQLLVWVHSHAPSIWSHRGKKVVWPDFQPMRGPEKPVCILIFGQNPFLTSLHLKSPVHVVPPLYSHHQMFCARDVPSLYIVCISGL